MPFLTTAAAEDALEAVLALIDAGTTDPRPQLIVYDGTPPADAARR